jgi:DNA-binding response OmpR family regulator
MFRKKRILIADDDQRVINVITEQLNSSGYETISASNGIEALEQAQAQEPDMIILDILMPRMDGFQTLDQLRKYSNIPVIILSTQTSDINKIKGLNIGADDYLIKPFNAEELVARLEAIFRRSGSGDRTQKILNLGDITIDFDTQSVKVRNNVVQLTSIEWKLLNELASNIDHLIQYEQLLEKVWGTEYSDDVQLLRTWISRLRRKLEGDAATPVIRTVRNTGYIMEIR